jgi:hypothetical protein
MQEGFTVSGGVVFQGTHASPIPATLGGLWPIVIEASQYWTKGNEGAAAILDDQGRFRSLPRLIPGTYLVQCPMQLPGALPWHFRSATWGGRDLSISATRLGESIDGVVCTYSDQEPVINGGVVVPNGIQPWDLIVALFPLDPIRWVDNGDPTPDIRLASIRDGKYNFKNFLLPGDYYVIALPRAELQPLWPDAEYLRRCAAVATRIHVDDGQTLTVDLNVKHVS